MLELLYTCFDRKQVLRDTKFIRFTILRKTRQKDTQSFKSKPVSSVFEMLWTDIFYMITE